MLETIDNPRQERFDLILTSKSSAALCLSMESWPVDTVVPPGFVGAVLNTTTGPKGLLPTGSAYCPGGCGEVRLEPGRQLRGAIAYKAFGDSSEIAAELDRELEFTVHPYVCFP